jgi:putative transposase
LARGEDESKARLPIDRIEPVKRSDAEPEAVSAPDDLASLSEAEWQAAQERFEVIRPLVEGDRPARADVAAAAEKAGVHWVTLYRWIRRYLDAGVVSALVPEKPGPMPGSRRLNPEVEAIVDGVIETHYLTRQRRSVRAVCDEVKLQCRRAGLKAPHPNTVRKRISRLSERVRVSRRRGKDAANRFEPVRGRFEGAQAPLQVVQIDHTQADIILVDEVNRRPIGRPWVTFAVDVFTRVLTGFYVSFEAPGALGTGLCIAMAVLPKERWLLDRGVEGQWPVWGFPAEIHVDNAREFRGHMLKRACEQYGIDLVFRPKGQPKYGGHVERHIRTASTRIHDLPGTTFSSPRDRQGYDSMEKAALTLPEFERWLATFIVGSYHLDRHSELGMPPIKKYEEGLLGTRGRAGKGLPPRPVDEERIRLDFMPMLERTVQRYGLQVDGIRYYADALRPWIDAADPANPKAKRRFIVRRDPRDISVVWFLDPESNEYVRVPYANAAHPPMSVWDLQAVKREMRRRGESLMDEDAIFATYERLREIEESAVKETRKARRRAATRKAVASDPVHQAARKEPNEDGDTPIPGLLDDDVEGFEGEVRWQTDDT